ncbi:MurR/RpiR family transcriptional regulator [Robertmurraya korlensis]|jgi:DNA-binding MurR/RpiR family transcriptional regulator|uniref:MurR/RpiR family transcriptional regulator n=1 Tax=Robertmurraya korlensis TaxID=519977 RepID=UPI000825719B|nr:MurR/RpiR family transcriptional regulator [Robertmurraya korlensis]
MEQKTVTQIIKGSFSALSSGQKKVAEFLLEHLDEGSLLTAFQIGRKVGVSETTVIRLAYALGFSGYSEMQETIRREWLTHVQPGKSEGRPSSADELEENQMFHQIIEKESQVLKQLLNQLEIEQIWRVVDVLHQAKRIFIAGFGSSHAAAYWLYYALKQQRGNVFLSSPSGYLPEEICELDEQSTVLIFSYPRYRRESLKLANYANNQKATLVAVTDRQLSPIGQLAQLTLTTEEHLESSHHSIASVIGLLEVIISGMNKKNTENTSHRQKKLEQLYSEQNIFLE